jgi:hypothetical protein
MIPVIQYPYALQVDNVGLSTDSKPEKANKGTIYLELDTQKTYYWSGLAWVGFSINYDPTLKYKITDMDPTEGDSYFGYVDKDGAWYIMHLTASEARYIKGDSNYTTAWTGKDLLVYDYFYQIF